jgi:hypothetical protein
MFRKDKQEFALSITRLTLTNIVSMEQLCQMLLYYDSRPLSRNIPLHMLIILEPYFYVKNGSHTLGPIIILLPQIGFSNQKEREKPN